MKIHQNGDRFQVCDGAETLLVVDSLAEAELYVAERFSEARLRRQEKMERRQRRRAQLEGREYWQIKSGDAGYQAVCAVCLGMTLWGQVNDMCGHATVYASGSSAPEGWRRCDAEEKRDLVERILQDEEAEDD